MKRLRIGLVLFCLTTGLSATSGLAVDIKQGERVFKLCTYCHGDRGEGRQNLGAPSIAGLPEWYLNRQLVKFYDGVRGLHPRDLGGMRMHPMAMTLDKERDLPAVSKYVAALPVVRSKATVPGKILKGEASYKTCVACHGEAGQGNEAVGGPPIAQLDSWYVVLQLQNFKSGIRAGDPAKDPTGAAMTAIAAGLSPDDMNNLAAYLHVLREKQ